MHVECYKARPDIGAIVHTHSTMASAFACLNKPIPAFIFELFVFNLDHATIPVAPYALPGTTELAQNVANTVAKSDLVLMERHGTIAVGKDVDEAFENADYIEELAHIYYYILTLNNGKDTPCFTEEEFKELVNSVWRSLRTKRIINVNVKKAIVTGSVVSQSGISDWSFRLDFNYYGELCGKYRIFSDNPDSNIPKHFGDAIGIEIQNTLTKKRLKHKK